MKKFVKDNSKLLAGFDQEKYHKEKLEIEKQVKKIYKKHPKRPCSVYSNIKKCTCSLGECNSLMY